MNLTRFATPGGSRWALDGQWLRADFHLGEALAQTAAALADYIEAAKTGETSAGTPLAPIEAGQEVWACGVTYQRSRDARVAETQTQDVYTLVYDAERPEIFFKASSWRVRGDGEAVRIRADSRWNVPESELVLVVNAHGEIVGYTAGNDMSSRDIEGENPLYLPQAKVYDGSCALGPGIELCTPETMTAIDIALRIERAGTVAFEGRASSAQMKRTLPELAACVYAELSFPAGAFVMTGTCIVPPDEFTLAAADVITVSVGGLQLTNFVA